MSGLTKQSPQTQGESATIQPQHLTESKFYRYLWIALALLFVGLILILPLLTVVIGGLKKGAALYYAALTEPDAIAALKLTLLVAVIAVPLNTVFGVAAAWCITKFQFRGKQLLITLIDLPFAVSRSFQAWCSC